MDKTELGSEVQAAAQFELARDFESAGLLDRSEATFRQLLESGYREADACKSLMQLHERERDWAQATEIAKRALTLSEKKNNEEQSDTLRYRIAHYRCELAEDAFQSGYNDEAHRLLLEADGLYPNGARAQMALATAAGDLGDWESAAVHFQQVEKAQPSLLPDIISPWLHALSQLPSSNALDAFIKRISARKNAYSVVRATRDVIAERHGPERANRFFKDQMLQRPSLRGLRDWVADQVAVAPSSEREKVQTIHTLLDDVIEEKAQYQCASCGFKGNQLHWRCPSCGNWDTVQTIIGAEGE